MHGIGNLEKTQLVVLLKGGGQLSENEFLWFTGKKVYTCVKGYKYLDVFFPSTLSYQRMIGPLATKLRKL